jgi:hypothetical protein
MVSVRSAAVLAAFVVLALCAATADAQRRDGPCVGDVKNFCSDVRPGDGRMYRCLTDHKARLSRACRDRMNRSAERLQSLATACQSDIEKHCKGASPGDGRILACLKERQGDLEHACMAELRRARKDRSIAR